MLSLKAIMTGGIMVSAWAISVFFLRFWKKTRDPLLLLFSVAFLLLGVEHAVIFSLRTERQFVAYVIRLIAFLLILLAIWNKNRRNDKR